MYRVSHCHARPAGGLTPLLAAARHCRARQRGALPGAAAAKCRSPGSSRLGAGAAGCRRCCRRIHVQGGCLPPQRRGGTAWGRRVAGGARAAGGSTMQPPCLPAAIARGGSSMVSLLLEHGAVMPGQGGRPCRAALLEGLKRFAHSAFRLRHAHAHGRLAGISAAQSDLDDAAAVCAVVTQSRGGGYLPPWTPPSLPIGCKTQDHMESVCICPRWVLHGVIQPALLQEAPPQKVAEGGGSSCDWTALSELHRCEACSSVPNGCTSLVLVPQPWHFECSVLRQLWGRLHPLQPWSRRRALVLAAVRHRNMPAMRDASTK